MGCLRNNSNNVSPRAFTRLELVVVLACIGLLSLLALPLLGRSRASASDAVCMNNLRNLGRAMLIYADQTGGFVPEEGISTSLINNSVNSKAWYNAEVQPEYPALTNLYTQQLYPLPGNGTIYSCPASPPPATSPSKAFAYFMYGENNWLCVNQSTRTTYGQNVQTRFATIPQPSATILLGDNDGTSGSAPAYSGITPNYVAVRHGLFAQFVMCDGSVRAFATNEFNHISTSAAVEWYVNHTDASAGINNWPCYWWPTSTTLQ
ncbi:MAG: type II secretion system protein [Limisphaerales bacterium]